MVTRTLDVVACSAMNIFIVGVVLHPLGHEVNEVGHQSALNLLGIGFVDQFQNVLRGGRLSQKSTELIILKV